MNSNRKFLADVVKSGLELGTITSDDVLRHITPEILAHHLSVALKTKLLEASLKAEKMTSGLIVETIGAEALAEHSPVAALWACVTECARRLLAGEEEVASSPGLPALESTGEHKPSKAASPRPSGVRMPGRVSSLSPRSRPPLPARNGNGRPEPGDELGGLDTRVRADSPDFEIDEDEMRGGIRVGRELKVDEETRPGDINTRKA
jgi:hypothetical protein